MGEIKSAWELALEKTKDIVVDKEALKEKELKTKGRKAAFTYLEDPQSTQLEVILSETGEKDRPAVLTGMGETFLSYLKFPRTEEGNSEVLDKIQSGLKSLSDHPDIDYLFEQIGGLFKQYIDDHTNLKERIKQQIGPQLAQKAQAIAAQTGMDPEKAMEADPEFRKILEQNLKSMDQQYGAYLEQVKGHIKGMLGLRESE